MVWSRRKQVDVVVDVGSELIEVVVGGGVDLGRAAIVELRHELVEVGGVGGGPFSEGVASEHPALV